MTTLKNMTREIKTKNLFQSQRSKAGGIIFIRKGHLHRSLCWDTLIREINARSGFTLCEYSWFYIVLCNSGAGSIVDTSKIKTA